MFATLLILITCVLIAVIGIPLGLRLIPPNRVYGVRTRRTLSDESAWFEVNRVGGWALVAAAGLAAVIVMAYQGTWLRPWWSQWLVLLFLVIVAVGFTFYFEQRILPPQKSSDD
jgi:uncharacterized membrane protein